MLAEARKKMKLTQEEVAKEIGISRSFYGLIEIGKRRPTYGMARNRASILNRPIDELYFDIEGFKMNRTSA